MKAYHFTEMPYPHLPPQEAYASDRVSLPSRHFDPGTGADLYAGLPGTRGTLVVDNTDPVISDVTLSAAVCTISGCMPAAASSRSSCAIIAARSRFATSARSADPGSDLPSRRTFATNEVSGTRIVAS